MAERCEFFAQNESRCCKYALFLSNQNSVSKMGGSGMEKLFLLLLLFLLLKLFQCELVQLNDDQFT